jgi:hypothetical protein
MRSDAAVVSENVVSSAHAEPSMPSGAALAANRRSRTSRPRTSPSRGSVSPRYQRSGACAT